MTSLSLFNTQNVENDRPVGTSNSNRALRATTVAAMNPVQWKQQQKEVRQNMLDQAVKMYINAM
jgi:hypothetical protein